MPTPTLEPIATTTLASAAASITFSGIPNTYTDLRWALVSVGDAAASGAAVLCRFNNDSGSNYSFTYIYGDGVNAQSGRSTAGGTSLVNIGPYVSLSITTPTLFTGNVFTYSGSQYKTMLCEASGDMNGSGVVNRLVALWRSTAQISAMVLYPSAGNFAAGTTATLYGIARAA